MKNVRLDPENSGNYFDVSTVTVSRALKEFDV
jgi:hypothetical protein